MGVAVATLLAAPLLSGTPALAQHYWHMSCEQLWSMRNAIYAAEGDCFKTPRAPSSRRKAASTATSGRRSSRSSAGSL